MNTAGRQHTQNKAYVSDNAWSKVYIEAQETLQLPGKPYRTQLEVTVINNSAETLDPDSGQGILFSFRLMGVDSPTIDFECVRTPLGHSVAPGQRHTQNITVAIPETLRNQVTAIRIGLIQKGKYWVERVNRDHAKIVHLDFGKHGKVSHAQQVVAQASQIWPQGRNNGLGWPLGSLMVSREHKILYVPVAKCACTSLKSMMVELAGIERPEMAVELGIHFVTDRFNTGVQLKDFPRETAQDILSSDQYFKFSVIREPFERLVSAYMEKFVYNRKGRRNLLHTRPVISQVQGREDIDLERGISFDEFVGHITSSDPMDLDTHWRPQSLYMAGIEHMSRIYRLEDISGLESHLLTRFGIKVRLAHKNRTRKSGRSIDGVAQKTADEIDRLGAFDHASFSSSLLREAVEDYFREDFKLYMTCRRDW